MRSPGVGITGARVIIAEVGVEMSRFPHRCAPELLGPFRSRVKESAGRKKGRGTTGHGNRYLARSSEKPPSPPARLTPSRASATGVSPNATARKERSSRSGAPF